MPLPITEAVVISKNLITFVGTTTTLTLQFIEYQCISLVFRKEKRVLSIKGILAEVQESLL